MDCSLVLLQSKKNPTIDIVKLNGREIDILLKLCVPAGVRIGIMPKPVSERRNKLLEKTISNIKIGGVSRSD